MPRQSRIQIPGGMYHVITRGLERRDIFRDDADRISFLSRFEAGLKKTGSECLAWALMSNHCHLLIRSGSKPLSDLMRKLLTGYALSFNRKYKRHGYLFQNRYKSVLCQEDVYLLELLGYIHVNPVRAGIVKTLEELDTYPWTGHTAIVGRKSYLWQSVNEVLLLFGRKKKDAIRRYRGFVRDRMHNSKRDDLEGGGLVRSAGGWDELKKMQKRNERWLGDERILGDGLFVEEILKEAKEQAGRKEQLKKEGWTIERLAQRICDYFSVDAAIFQKKGRNNSVSIAKELLCYYGYRDLGIGTKQLSEYLGISRYSVIKNAEKGEHYCRKTSFKLLS